MPIEIKKLNSTHINSIIVFCESLRRENGLPCSFWNYSIEYIDLEISNSNKIYFDIFSIDNSLAALGVISRGGGAYQKHLGRLSVLDKLPSL